MQMFVYSSLPSLHGPLVKIQLNPFGAEYTLSRAVLVSRCPYIARMFSGSFREGIEQYATIEEIEGVISVKSFEVLLTWLYLGTIGCAIQEPGAKTSALIKFARLSDMFGINKVGPKVAILLKETLIANPPPYEPRRPDANTRHLTPEDIRSVFNLPMGHRVRSLIAAASVAGFLSKKDHQFAKVAREVPTFGADLLVQVQATLGGIQYDSSWMAHVTDPITKRPLYLTKL